MARFVRRWHYETYFSGAQTISVELDTTEEEVATLLDNRHISGNWKRASLKRGDKVKEKRA